MHRLDPLARPHRVVELQRLPRVARVGITIGIAGGVEGDDRDVVHPQMIGVRVALLAVGIRDDHLGPLTPDDLDEPSDGLVEVGPGEATRVFVLGCVGHARVAVAEPDDLVVADDLRRGRQLAAAHRRRGRPGPRDVSIAGIEDRAGLATGAAHEHAPRALVVVPGDRAGALRRLVVGVGVHGEQTELVSWCHENRFVRYRGTGPQTLPTR